MGYCRTILLYIVAVSSTLLYVHAQVEGYDVLNRQQSKYMDENGNVQDGNGISASCATSTDANGNMVCTCGDESAVVDIEPMLTFEEMMVKARAVAQETNNRQKCKKGQRPNLNVAGGNCASGSSRVKPLYSESDEGEYTLVVTNGIPAHCTDFGQDRPNANIPCEQYRVFIVPHGANDLSNIDVDKPYVISGLNAITKMGSFLFKDTSAEDSCDAAPVAEKINMDVCDGHCTGGNFYHHHKMPYPSEFCMGSAAAECSNAGIHRDGVPIYTPCTFYNSDGSTTSTKACYKLLDILLADSENAYGCDTGDYEYSYEYNDCNLDAANGMKFTEDKMDSDGNVIFKADTYVYFFSESFPYLPPKIVGQSATYVCIIDPTEN